MTANADFMTDTPDSVAPTSRLIQTLGSSVARVARVADATGVSAIIGPGAMPDGLRYRAFISYCHRDERVARWLRRAIETYRIPGDLVGKDFGRGPIPRRLSPVFRDEDELPGAAELGPELKSALRASAALLVLCSQASAKSIWVDKEIQFFKSQFPKRPVFALIADGAPGGDEECFPPALLTALGPDGALVPDPAAEPLAPDLQKQDKHAVKLKIVAGLLGVKYNDLFRRDRRRQRMLMGAFGTLAFVVISALSVLSILAVSAANRAIQERNRAQVAEKLAEKNAEEADRRAWLAQTAAVEVRRQGDLLAARKQCP